jgi:hypothetical protein
MEIIRYIKVGAQYSWLVGISHGVHAKVVRKEEPRVG